jgi:hypothetical protein
MYQKALMKTCYIIHKSSEDGKTQISHQAEKVLLKIGMSKQLISMKIKKNGQKSIGFQHQISHP